MIPFLTHLWQPGSRGDSKRQLYSSPNLFWGLWAEVLPQDLLATFLLSVCTRTLVCHCSWFLYLCVSAVSVPRGNKGRGKSLIREGSLGPHFQNPLPDTLAISFPRGTPGKLSETELSFGPRPLAASARQGLRGLNAH